MTSPKTTIRTKVLFTALSVVLLSARLLTPFLHSHTESHNTEVHFRASVCPACEFESTVGIEPETTPRLSEQLVSYHTIAVSFISPFFSCEAPTSESLRGPPLQS